MKSAESDYRTAQNHVKQALGKQKKLFDDLQAQRAKVCEYLQAELDTREVWQTAIDAFEVVEARKQQEIDAELANQLSSMQSTAIDPNLPSPSPAGTPGTEAAEAATGGIPGSEAAEADTGIDAGSDQDFNHVDDQEHTFPDSTSHDVGMPNAPNGRKRGLSSDDGGDDESPDVKALILLQANLQRKRSAAKSPRASTATINLDE